MINSETMVPKLSKFLFRSPLSLEQQLIPDNIPDIRVPYFSRILKIFSSYPDNILKILSGCKAVMASSSPSPVRENPSPIIPIPGIGMILTNSPAIAEAACTPKISPRPCALILFVIILIIALGTSFGYFFNNLCKSSGPFLAPGLFLPIVLTNVFKILEIGLLCPCVSFLIMDSCLVLDKNLSISSYF